MVVTIVVAIVIVGAPYAGEAGPIGPPAGPLVAGKFRIRTERSLKGDALSRIVVDVFRGDDRFRGDAGFHPMVERRKNVIRRIRRLRTVDALPERVCTGSTAAMRHAGHHEQPIEFT